MAYSREDIQAITDLAQWMQVEPGSLAGLFEQEASGKANIWGGAGGQYYGLIQMGPGARKEVGLPSGPLTAAQQMPYIKRYFQQRGFVPGKHGVTEMYRTVLVGNPGQGGTDSFGTNSDSAAKRMLPGGDLYKRATAKLGGAGVTTPAAAESSGAAPAGAPALDLASALLGDEAALVPRSSEGLDAGAQVALAGLAGKADPSGTPSLARIAGAQLASALAQPERSLSGAAAAEEGKDLVNLLAQPAGSSAAATSPGAGEIGIVDLGKRLQALGFKVAENPAFGGVGKHSKNSHHYSGNALDLTIQSGSPLLSGRPDSDWKGLTASKGALLKAAIPGAEIFHPGDDPVGGHHSHIHLALPSGKTRITPQLAALLRLNT